MVIVAPPEGSGSSDSTGSGAAEAPGWGLLSTRLSPRLLPPATGARRLQGAGCCRR